jgi:hypothetical protein
MTPVPLTKPMIDLLLVLLDINRDLLDAHVLTRFGPRAGFEGRVPDENDMRVMRELELTQETIKVLEAAK